MSYFMLELLLFRHCEENFKGKICINSEIAALLFFNIEAMIYPGAGVRLSLGAPISQIRVLVRVSTLLQFSFTLMHSRNSRCWLRLWMEFKATWFGFPQTWLLEVFEQ